MLSRHFALHRDNSSLALKPATRSIPALLPTQILINVKAASLNYRDLLNMGDVDGTREGLIPLSDAAGVVAETGSAVPFRRRTCRLRWAAAKPTACLGITL